MKRFLSLLLISCLSVPVWAQIRTYTQSFQIKAKDVVRPAEPPAVQNVSKHIMLKPGSYYILTPTATKDTVTETDLTVFYKDKCPVTKGLDPQGCVNFTYEDGTKRIVCDKQYEAIVTPDGKVHLLRQMTMYSLTFPLTPPTLPADQSILVWLNNYNDALLENLLNFAYEGDQAKLKEQILTKERSMRLNVYGQVVNRVNLLEQFARIR